MIEITAISVLLLFLILLLATLSSPKKKHRDKMPFSQRLKK